MATNRFYDGATNMFHDNVMNNLKRDVLPKEGVDNRHRVGAKAYKDIMDVLVLLDENPCSELGLFVSNSTKRDIKSRLERVIRP